MPIPTFSHKKVLLPVIHVENLDQALRNCALAHEANCDGVFLINHENADGVRELTWRKLLEIHATVRARWPNWWIGVNFLDLAAADVFACVDSGVNGIWADNGEIDERDEVQVSAENILAAKAESGWDGAYFGGVAFKYQRPVADAALAAQIGANYIDVVTTSGPGTGESASVDKISAMKQALGKRPLALASGITPDNVRQYLPYADIFLVATGISHSFYELDAAKVAELTTIIHGWDGSDA